MKKIQISNKDHQGPKMSLKTNFSRKMLEPLLIIEDKINQIEILTIMITKIMNLNIHSLSFKINTDKTNKISICLGMIDPFKQTTIFNQEINKEIFKIIMTDLQIKTTNKIQIISIITKEIRSTKTNKLNSNKTSLIIRIKDLNLLSNFSKIHHKNINNKINNNKCYFTLNKTKGNSTKKMAFSHLSIFLRATAPNLNSYTKNNLSSLSWIFFQLKLTT